MAIFTRFIRNRSLVLIVLFTGFSSCSESEESSASTAEKLSGEQLYMQKCISCHGKNGDLGVSGAANLSKSSLSFDDKSRFIKEGSSNGIMQAYGEKFGGSLNDEQIQKLTEYIETLAH